MNATQTGLHSGVDDPIWHLSRILARKKAHEYNCLENGAIAVGTLQQQITAIEKDIQTEYNPHPRMFKELRPLIREYLKHERGSHRQFLKKLKDATNITTDHNRSQQAQQFVQQITTQHNTDTKRLL